MKAFKTGETSSDCYHYFLTDNSNYYFIWYVDSRHYNEIGYVIDHLRKPPTLTDIETMDNIMKEQNQLKRKKRVDNILREYMVGGDIVAGFNQQTFIQSYEIYQKYQKNELTEISIEQLLTHSDKEIRELIKTFIKSEGKDKT